MQGPKHNLRTNGLREKKSANIYGDEEQATSREKPNVHTKWMEEFAITIMSLFFFFLCLHWLFFQVYQISGGFCYSTLTQF